MPLARTSLARDDGDAAVFASRLALQYGLDEVPWSSTGARSALVMAAVRYDLPHLFVLPPLPAEEAFAMGVELSTAATRSSQWSRGCVRSSKPYGHPIITADLNMPSDTDSPDAIDTSRRQMLVTGVGMVAAAGCRSWPALPINLPAASTRRIRHH